LTELDEQTTAAARSDFGGKRLAGFLGRVRIKCSRSPHDLPTGWIANHTI
jgi:hypothetical protein